MKWTPREFCERNGCALTADGIPCRECAHLKTKKRPSTKPNPDRSGHG